MFLRPVHPSLASGMSPVELQVVDVFLPTLNLLANLDPRVPLPNLLKDSYLEAVLTVTASEERTMKSARER